MAHWLACLKFLMLKIGYSHFHIKGEYSSCSWYPRFYVLEVLDIWIWLARLLTFVKFPLFKISYSHFRRKGRDILGLLLPYGYGAHAQILSLSKRMGGDQSKLRIWKDVSSFDILFRAGNIWIHEMISKYSLELEIFQ